MKKALLFLALFSLTRSFGQSVRIGDILCTDGSIIKAGLYVSSGKTAEGIVFYVDASDARGWVVALENQSSSIKWCSEEFYGYDLPDLTNYGNARASMHDLDGHTNTGIIRSQGNRIDFPAAWAVDYNNGWYLPSAGQLRYLYSLAPEINASLRVVGGTALPYHSNNYWWSSTEHTGYHAFDMNTGGSLGDYVKDNYVNYPPSGIGVRQIKDFTLPHPVHPEHHVGDLITNDDGSRGILFYVNADQTEGWMVALIDASTSIPWGSNGDVPSLTNQTCTTPYGALLDETDGFANTTIIRSYQTGLSTAANAVDYPHGWYLPTAGQLSKLFGALPFIEDKLQTYGSTFAEDYYWSSSEANVSNAFALSFRPEANVRAGHFVRSDKSLNYRVRAVRNLHFETPPPDPTLPDNILDDDCNTPIQSTPWGIQLLYSSHENDIASYSPLLAGDINNDGVTDIVVARCSDNYYHSNSMYVFSGNDLSVQSCFDIPDTLSNYIGYAIGRYPMDNGELQGAIFVHPYDKYIRAYAIDGTLLRVSDRPTSCDGMISLADFNGDGYPEIYSGNDIFDAATLKWLCSGPSNGNRGLGFRGPPLHTAVNTHHTYYAMSLAYDIFGDAKQELICGNTIYDVNITSRTNPALNAVTENKTISPPIGFSQDGHVLVADFDLDGQDEVLVLRDDTDDHTLGNCYIYAYKPTTGHILFQKSHYAYCTSYPLIGNIDDDPYPEIVLLEKQLYSPAKMFCWRFTQQSGLTTVWEQEHNDSSGQTGLTLFDFNQDGIMEIVYRDNRNMRILNGSGKSHVTGNDTIRPYDLYNRMMSAGTGVEYPIVADVNNDGHAEIVATGLLGSTQEVGYGGIHVFGNPGNWSPARPVWNQYMYHVTNVNEDLTIPTACFDKATIFTGIDGAIHRPYNNFLQQATYITPTGEPVGTQGEPQLVDIYGELNGQYVWNGTIYTQPGNYTQSFTDINGCDSIVTLHLTYPLNYPDNILEDNCNAPLQGSTWDVHLLYSTPGTPVASYAPILAGDIDGNGVVDIVMAHYNGNNYRTKTLDIYSGLDLSLQYRFNIQDSIYVSNGPYALGKYIKDDGTQQGAIFVHGYDKRIRSYTINGTLLNVSDRATSCDGMVSLADFNGDGYPEVYVGNDIFDAATLKWLCSGPEDGNKGLSFRGAAVGVVNHHRCYFAMSHASNVLGDERQELICGNTIYNVDIASRTNPNLNSITVNKTITPPNGYPNDGHVSLADLDLDGECEVLVIRDHTDDHTYGTTYFYAYRPSDEHILFQNTVQCLCTGYPLVGNIDDDPHPEIVFLEKQSYNPMYLYCWRYTSQNGLSTVWRQPHNDTSGQTGITLFDFNQDNIMELVYRDSESLRIINGSGKSHLTGNDTICPYNLYSRRMAAGTGVEYPTIADINGDGSAEIVASGLLDQSANLPGNGGIHVFGNPGNWSPARPVWNQYMYHVTNVNEDLTIPTYCFDKATVFTDANGTVRRPYNNFLQQAGYITPTGEPYNPSGQVEAEFFGVGCSTYTYQDSTYTESGDYEYLIENPWGCDTLMTVHVQLGDTIYDIQHKSACSSYIWNDTVYNETGVYEQTFTSAQGCDSIVTLYLTIENQIFTQVAVSACDSYSWNGTTYNGSGIYEQTFTSAQGCDSIVTLNLTIKDAAQVGHIHGEHLIHYQTYGTYSYIIDPVPGCFGYEWSLDGPWSLTSSPDSPECTIDINSNGTATLKVRVYTECGCVERTLFIDHDARPDVVIYPNPTKGDFNIVLYGMQGEAVIVIYDYLGQFIDRFSVDTDLEGTIVPYSLNGKSAGVYLVNVMNHYERVTKKVVKETPSVVRIFNWQW